MYASFLHAVFPLHVFIQHGLKCHPSVQRHPTECLFAGNGNGLLYCILFMIYIDRFSSALWTAHCHFPAWIQTSIFLSSAIRWKLSPSFPAEKRSWKPRSDSTVRHSLRRVCAKATLGHSSPLLLQQPSLELTIAVLTVEIQYLQSLFHSILKIMKILDYWLIG